MSSVRSYSSCAILYAIPDTAVLGAILVTGFLGGAICAHVRMGELGSAAGNHSLLLGAMTWDRRPLPEACDPRIRAIPCRSSVEPTGAVLCPSRSGENACF